MILRRLLLLLVEDRDVESSLLVEAVLLLFVILLVRAHTPKPSHVSSSDTTEKEYCKMLLLIACNRRRHCQN
jgi:hypothetical protein